MFSPGMTRFTHMAPPTMFFRTAPHKRLRLSSGIIDIKNIQDMLQHVDAHTLVVCDLDLTLIRLTQSLGCDRWFDGNIVEQHEIHGDMNKALADTLQLYTQIQKRSKVKTIEEGTAMVIQSLYSKADSVLALTARDSGLQDATIKQLASMDISFDQGLHTSISVQLIQSPTSYAHHGIVFCAGNNKSSCLEEYLRVLDYKPNKILFIDDKIKHIHAVKDMCDRFGIDFLGFHYTRTHEEPDVDNTITKNQLEVFLERGELISDEKAVARVASAAKAGIFKPAFI